MQRMEESDADALALARTGDSEGFRVLVERHSRAVFRLAYRMTGNEHDAEDVVQEAFLRAYRRLHQYDQRARFSSWLHRIAANCAYDQLRARRRRDGWTHAAPEPGRPRALPLRRGGPLGGPGDAPRRLRRVSGGARKRASRAGGGSRRGAARPGGRLRGAGLGAAGAAARPFGN